MKQLAIALLCYIIVWPYTSQACELNMGWEPWKPYQFKNEHGEITGIDIELLTLVAEDMGCQLKLHNRPWLRLLSDIKSGNMDILSGASFTEERTKWVYYSQPYRDEKRVLFMRKGQAEKYPINSLNDLIALNVSLGATRGEYNGPKFEEMMKQEAFNRLFKDSSKELINLKKLLAGRLDAVILDQISGSRLFHSLGAENKIEIHPFTIHQNNIHIILSKHSMTKEHLNAVNTTLNKLKNNGEHQRILDKYLK